MPRIITTLLIALALCGTMSAQKNRNYDAARNLSLFTAIYKNLDMMYVDTLDASQVIGTGIRAMLKSLDPYTEYYAPEEVKDLKTMITGKYAGIGALIRYNLKSGNSCIDEPYEGMPAQEVGLIKGDEILAIDDSSMVGKATDYVSSRLRGDPGTTFKLKIFRPSTGKKMTVKITRRAIQMPSVPYYGMIGDGVGYISLSQFTEDCSKDVRRAFIDLRGQGMKRLIFDLRGNGGGSLQEAVRIVNMFVPKGVTIVTTKGKIRRANSEYVTTQEPIDTVMPLVVLVNNNTASASEITAGALQDLDRAVILGTRTYGKGLVQLPMDLPHKASMKLTTAKYYIPSGRCIQAINYSHSGTMKASYIPDSLTHVFHTKGGREVRDGGGIKPDVTLEADTMPNILAYLMSSGLDSTEVMNTWVLDYIAKHKEIAPVEEFEITDEEYADFKQAVINAGFKYDRETEKYYDDLVKMAKFEGYYDDAVSEFEALKKKLNHNLSHELDKYSVDIKRALAIDILPAYYYQRGALAWQLKYDKQLNSAKDLILDSDRYSKVFDKEQF